MDSGVLAAIMGIIGILIVIALIWLVISIIASWRIFTKAGEAGWKCLIPFYNSYVQFSFTWNTNIFWVWFGLSMVSNLISIIGGKNPGMIISLISFAIAVVVGVISIIATHKLSKAFGHGVGFTLGLLFLNPIFMLILAFGSSEYQGIPD